MSISPTSFAAGFAGAIAARSNAPEVERAAEATRSHEQHQSAAEETERASGLGETEEEQATQDRDADGRQVFVIEDSPKKKPQEEAAEEPQAAGPKDVTGDCGNLLDLQG
jgi:hypothetical protein